MAYLAWKVFIALRRFRWWDGYTSQNVFISNFFLRARAPLQIPTSLYEGPFFYFMHFFNLSVHLLLQKHQLGGNMIVLKYWV